jgi:hypothetical protein
MAKQDEQDRQIPTRTRSSCGISAIISIEHRDRLSGELDTEAVSFEVKPLLDTSYMLVIAKPTHSEI